MPITTENAPNEDSETAAQGFNSLSSQHARSAFFRGRGPILRVAAIAFALSLLAILVAIDSVRTNVARRYPAAIRWNYVSSAQCDAALGRRKFWVLDVVSSDEMCVDHTEPEHPPVVAEPGLRFLIIGDWGRDGMCCQGDVAYEMAKTARLSNPKPSFVVSTGDNFYLSGIETSKDGQVDRSWRNVYITPYESLRIPWKITLGNHDHEGNVAAQKVLGREDPYWHMPDLHYFETVGSGDSEVFIAFIDTTVMYYTEDQFSQFKGDMSLFRRDNQVAEIKKRLSETTAKWKLVVGHHPLFSSGENHRYEERNLKQLRTMLLHVLRDNGVAAYFSGHEHLMEHLTAESVHFFISGAGSKLSPITMNLDESIFVLDRQGYMDVVVRNDTSIMTVRMIDMNGHLVHEANVTRPK